MVIRRTGQVYTRRYWKLPIVVGAYLGLGYATSWNNGMLDDYSRAYRDIMDNDPTTNSYMDFFPPTVTEDSLDKTQRAPARIRRKGCRQPPPPSEHAKPLPPTIRRKGQPGCV